MVSFADIDRAAGTRLAESIVASGGACRFEHVDLADRSQRASLVTAVVHTWGRIDLLVNNAAITGRRNSLMDLSEDDWDRVLETNLTATAFLARDAAREMAGNGGGSIINLATIQERLPLPTHVPYVSSKGGISGLTRILAVELGPYGIRVNDVIPGVIQTAGMIEERLNVGLASAPGAEAQATLLPKAGQPEDVAGVIAFLASADAAFITGSTLTVDGGRSLSRKPDPLAEGLYSHHTVPAHEHAQPQAAEGAIQ